MLCRTEGPENQIKGHEGLLATFTRELQNTIRALFNSLFNQLVNVIILEFVKLIVSFSNSIINQLTDAEELEVIFATCKTMKVILDYYVNYENNKNRF